MDEKKDFSAEPPTIGKRVRVTNDIFELGYAEGVIRAIYQGDVISIALDTATLTPNDRDALLFSNKHMAYTWTSHPGEYEIMTGRIITGWRDNKGPRKA